MAQTAEKDVPDESPRDGALPLSNEFSLAELSHKVAVEAGIGEAQAEVAVRAVQHRSLYFGPHPSADEVAQYNAIKPDLGTRLVENFLVQQQHARELDNRALTIAEEDLTREDGWLKYARRGQSIAFAMLFAFLFSSLLCAFVLHQFTLAALFIAPPIIGIIAHFVRGADRK